MCTIGSSNLSIVNLKLEWKPFSLSNMVSISDSLIDASRKKKQQIQKLNKSSLETLSTTLISYSAMIMLANCSSRHDPIDRIPIWSKIMALRVKAFLAKQPFRSFFFVLFLDFYSY